MTGWNKTLSNAIVTGTVASVMSTVALALLARREGKGTFQPVNATSHWFNGDAAGSPSYRNAPAEAGCSNLGDCGCRRLHRHSKAIYSWMGIGA